MDHRSVGMRGWKMPWLMSGSAGCVHELCQVHALSPSLATCFCRLLGLRAVNDHLSLLDLARHDAGGAGRRKSSSAIVEDVALDNDDGGVDSYSIEPVLAERGVAGACAELAEERVGGAGGVLAERDIDGT